MAKYIYLLKKNLLENFKETKNKNIFEGILKKIRIGKRLKWINKIRIGKGKGKNLGNYSFL